MVLSHEAMGRPFPYSVARGNPASVNYPTDFCEKKIRDIGWK